MAQKFQNYIDGAWIDSSDGKIFENHNPANWDDLIGTFPLSTPEDVNQAAAAAADAFKSWRLVPAPSRGDICRKAGEIMVQRIFLECSSIRSPSVTARTADLVAQ